MLIVGCIHFFPGNMYNIKAPNGAVLSMCKGPVSTKPVFLTYVKRETDVRKKNWFVMDIGFLLTGQRTRIGPSRPLDG